MNFLFIAGHLGADPDVRFTSNGQKVTTLRVACNSRRSGKDETMWWRVTVWGEQFDKMIAYFKKGSSIMVQGEMHKPEMYTSKDGTQQISLNMTASQLMFSPFGKSSDERKENNSSNVEEVSAEVHQGTGEEEKNPDEDLPF